MSKCFQFNCRVLRRKTRPNDQEEYTTASITKRDLQQLALYWKLPNQTKGFWADNTKEEQLLMTLYKHARKLAPPVSLSPGGTDDDDRMGGFTSTSGQGTGGSAIGSGGGGGKASSSARRGRRSSILGRRGEAEALESRLKSTARKDWRGRLAEARLEEEGRRRDDQQEAVV